MQIFLGPEKKAHCLSEHQSEAPTEHPTSPRDIISPSRSNNVKNREDFEDPAVRIDLPWLTKIG